MPTISQIGSAVRSWNGLAGFILVSGLVILISRTHESGIFWSCFAVAFLPIALCTLPFWKLDRLPSWGLPWLVFAVLWGMLVASCSSILAAHANTLLISYVATTYLGWTFADGVSISNLLTSIINSPGVEELAKGSLAIFLLWHPKRKVTGAWHGVWIVSLTALGFGWVENAVLASNVVQHGNPPWEVFWSRSYLPLIHVGMVIPFGAAIGLASRLPTLSQRMGLLLLGWFLSSAIHAGWNWLGLFRNEDSGFLNSVLFLATVTILLTSLAIAFVFYLEKQSLQRQLVAEGIRVTTPQVEPASRYRFAQLSRLARSLPPDEVESKETSQLRTLLDTQTEVVSFPSAG